MMLRRIWTTICGVNSRYDVCVGGFKSFVGYIDNAVLSFVLFSNVQLFQNKHFTGKKLQLNFHVRFILSQEISIDLVEPSLVYQN